MLEIERDAGGIARLLAWIDRRCGALCLAERVAAKVRLCLEEAVQNILSHGEPCADLPPLITIRLCVNERGCCARVEDHGPAFDPLAAAPSPAAKDVASASIGGLGIVLIRCLARDVRYERLGGLNRLTICLDQ